jgi:ferric-dicitrate binding protein FerR (iron transport regulator)
MNKRQFIHILRKYRAGKASGEEKELIDSYYDLFELEPEDENWPSARRQEEIKQQALDDIWERIRAAKGGRGREGKRLALPVAWKIAAAALLVLATGLLAYLRTGDRRIRDRDHPVAASAAGKGSIHPGGRHAVLTLANGQQVILDSARDGVIARQGASRVIKLSNGQLAYRNAVFATAPGQVLYNTITTPQGGEYQVTLPDGSRVWLNAASSIRIPTAFVGGIRSVEVTGEAYFEIGEESDKPFVVEMGGAKIEVLGTHFNVNAYPDEGHVKTTLTAGSIKVSKGGVSRILKPGQQADMDRKTGVIAVGEANVDEALAWKNGLFYFDNTNIKTIMREISRWYNVEVVYKGDEVDQNTFSGVMSRYGDVEALLKRLELTGTVHFTITGTQITVSG